MRLIRIALALMIACGAFVASYRFAYLPWRADVERKRLERITLALWERQSRFGQVRARENVADARRYLDRGVHNTGLYMITAANYRLLDDYDQAVAMYREALQYDRRPELYYNVGLMELGRGRKEEAREALIYAALFNPYYILDIHDEETRNAVERAVAPRRVLPWLVK